MNKFIESINALDRDALVAMIDRDPKWINWSEPSGKNALHYLCGLGPFDDAAKAETSLAILRLLLKSGMDMNSIHRITDKNCGYCLREASLLRKDQNGFSISLAKGIKKVVVFSHECCID